MTFEQVLEARDFLGDELKEFRAHMVTRVSGIRSEGSIDSLDTYLDETSKQIQRSLSEVNEKIRRSNKKLAKEIRRVQWETGAPVIQTNVYADHPLSMFADLARVAGSDTDSLLGLFEEEIEHILDIEGNGLAYIIKLPRATQRR